MYTNAKPMENYINLLIREIIRHANKAHEEIKRLELKGMLDQTKPEHSDRESAIKYIDENLEEARAKFKIVQEKMPGVLEMVEKNCRDTAKTLVDGFRDDLLYKPYEMLFLPRQLPEHFRTEWYQLQQKVRDLKITNSVSLGQNKDLMQQYEKFKTALTESLAVVYTEKAKKELTDKQSKITEDFASIEKEPQRYRQEKLGAFKEKLEKLQKDLQAYHKTFKYMVLEFLGFEKDSKAKLERVTEALKESELQPTSTPSAKGEDIAKAVDETEQYVKKKEEYINTPPLPPHKMV